MLGMDYNQAEVTSQTTICGLSTWLKSVSHTLLLHNFRLPPGRFLIGALIRVTHLNEVPLS